MGRTPNITTPLRLRSAFTLVEVLLVVAIGGILAAVLVPMTYRSLHGNQRRMAVRSVVAVAKYARSMAVLQQRQMLLTIDVAGGKLVVDAAPTGRKVEAAGLDVVAGTPSGVTGPGGVPTPVAAPSEPVPFNGVPVRLQRELAPIKIVAVSVDGIPEGTTGGARRVRFDTNGRCQSFEVVLEDARGERVRVAVDHLGTAVTEVLP